MIYVKYDEDVGEGIFKPVSRNSAIWLLKNGPWIGYKFDISVNGKESTIIMLLIDIHPDIEDAHITYCDYIEAITGAEVMPVSEIEYYSIGNKA